MIMSNNISIHGYGTVSFIAEGALGMGIGIVVIDARPII